MRAITERRARSRRGFTLLEVLIALAIVALTLVALVRSTGLGTNALAREREVTLATWVAANVITELRVEEGFPAPGRRDGRMRMGEREFVWELTVQNTDEPALRRLDVRVYEDDARTRPIASLAGFAGAP
jgi:general secretion pathway protein I